MTEELKTLEDMQLGYEGYPPEDENIRKELRQEAIKWVKKQKECGDEFVFAVEEFMDFFNITEEDLKCK